MAARVVTAKRRGWNEQLTQDQELDMDPYEYEGDDDLEGELVEWTVPATDEHAEIHVCLVGGQDADPATVTPKETKAAEACRVPAGQPDGGQYIPCGGAGGESSPASITADPGLVSRINTAVIAAVAKMGATATAAIERGGQLALSQRDRLQALATTAAGGMASHPMEEWLLKQVVQEFQPMPATFTVAKLVAWGATKAILQARGILSKGETNSESGDTADLVAANLEAMRALRDGLGVDWPLPEESEVRGWLGVTTAKAGEVCRVEAGTSGGGRFTSCGSSGGGSGSDITADATRATIVAKATAAAQSAPGLTDVQRKQYGDAVKQVTDRMTPKALEKVHQAVKEYQFYASPKELTAAIAERSPAFAAIGASGRAAAGAFRWDTGTFSGDGGQPITAGKDAGKEMPAAYVYAHEFGHAIDGATGERISDTPAWQAAWKSEIAGDKVTLSKYGQQNALEGFAEFSRVVHTASRPEVLAQKFPQCTAVWRSEGLMQ